MKTLLQFFGLLKSDVSGPAHAGSTRAILYNLYADENGWYFNWYTEDHSRGECKGPFPSKELAEHTKAQWQESTKNIVLVAA